MRNGKSGLGDRTICNISEGTGKKALRLRWLNREEGPSTTLAEPGRRKKGNAVTAIFSSFQNAIPSLFFGRETALPFPDCG